MRAKQRSSRSNGSAPEAVENDLSNDTEQDLQASQPGDLVTTGEEGPGDGSQIDESQADQSQSDQSPNDDPQSDEPQEDLATKDGAEPQSAESDAVKDDAVKDNAAMDDLAIDQSNKDAAESEVKEDVEASVQTDQTEPDDASADDASVDDMETPSESSLEDTSHEDQIAVDPSKASAKKGGFLPLVAGGAIAAALGFFGGQLGGFMPGNGSQDALIEELRAEIEQLNTQSEQGSEANALLSERVSVIEQGEGMRSERLNELETRLQTLPTPTDTSDIEAALAATAAQIEVLAANAQQGDALEASALDETLKQLGELRDLALSQGADIEALRAEMQQTQEGAEQAERLSIARAALGDMRSSIARGDPFETALSTLQETELVAVPETLTSLAPSGVTRIADLQARFPALAREAIANSRASNEDESAGLGGFLQRQLNVRSVEPREGDSADAVLSRLEAALKNEELGEALQLADQLEGESRLPLESWIEELRMRLDAQGSLDQLASALEAL